MTGIETGLRRVEDALAAIAAAALLVLTGLMVLGVVLRYVVSEPLSWALGFTTEYLLTAIFFLGLPYTVRAGAHVRIDLLYRLLGTRARWWCTVVGGVLSALFVALLTWGGIRLAAGAWAGGDIPPPGGAELSWPVWTSTVLVPIGALVTAARLVLQLVGAARAGAPAADPTGTEVR